MTRIVMYFAEKVVVHIVNNLLFVSNASSTETASNSSFDETRNAIPVWWGGEPPLAPTRPVQHTAVYWRWLNGKLFVMRSGSFRERVGFATRTLLEHRHWYWHRYSAVCVPSSEKKRSVRQVHKHETLYRKTFVTRLVPTVSSINSRHSCSVSPSTVNCRKIVCRSLFYFISHILKIFSISFYFSLCLVLL